LAIITLTKDPTPPANQTETSPITIPDGTTLITTKNFNDFIDKMGGENPLTAGRVLQTDFEGNLEVSSTTIGTLAFLDVTSPVQPQLDAKAGLATANEFSANQKIGSIAISDPDTGLAVARTLSVSTNSHGLSHEDTITSTTPNRGHNSFDSKMIVTGTENHDHIAGFQARPTYSSTGTMDRLTGFQSLPVHDGGLVNDLRHFEARDASGSGPITNQYGFAVRQPLTRGTNNFAFHSQTGENDNRFGGRVLVDSENNFDAGLLVTTNYGTFSPKWRSRVARGTEAAPTELIDGQAPLNIESYGYINGDFRRMSLIQVLASGTPSPTSYASRVRFGSVVTGSTAVTNRMTFENDGSIDFQSNTVTGIPDGVNPTDAVNKQQLDAATTGGSSPHVIQEEGVGLPQRTNLNFIGAELTVTDNPGNDSTDFTFGLPDVPTLTIRGNDTGAAGPIKNLTVAEVTTMLAVASVNAANTFTAEQTIEDSNFIVTRDGISGEVGPNFVARGMRGTIAAPTLPADEDRLGTFVAQGWDSAAFRAAGRFSVDVDGTPAAGSMPGKVEIHTTPDGSVATQRRLVIRQNGDIECLNNTIKDVGDAQNLADVPNLGQVGAVAQYANADTTTDINVAAPGITLSIIGNQEVLDTGFTRIDNQQMQCDFTGLVEVHCNLRAISAGARASISLQIRKKWYSRSRNFRFTIHSKL